MGFARMALEIETRKKFLLSGWTECNPLSSFYLLPKTSETTFFGEKCVALWFSEKNVLVNNKSTKGSNLQWNLVLTRTEISKCLLHRISIDMHRNLGFGSFGIPQMSTFNYFRYFAFQSVRTLKFKLVKLSIVLFAWTKETGFKGFKDRMQSCLFKELKKYIVKPGSWDLVSVPVVKAHSRTLSPC